MLPSISFVVPVLNEALKLRRALESIVAQDYPSDRIEVLVADGGSTDGSREVAEEFKKVISTRVLDNSARRQAAWGKALAIENASGDIIQLMDADVWMTSGTMLRNLVAPMAADPSLGGAIAPYAYVPGLSVWTRFLSSDEFQRDPLVEALTPRIEHFVVEEHATFAVCQFNSERIPPIGQTTTYWRRDIDLSAWGGLFIEDDMPIKLIRSGRNRFALLRTDGFGHEHCTTLKDLVGKRVRNLLGMDSSWMRRRSSRDYAWLDIADRSEVLSFLLWILTTHLILPRFLEGVVAALRLRRWEPLLRPIVALSVTDALLVATLRSKEGRKFIRESLGLAR